MRLIVSGHGLKVGDELRTRVTRLIETSEAKYAERPTDATVTFSRDGSAFECELTMHLSTGMSAQAHASSQDIFVAFKQAYERLEKQLRRYKRRLKDHH